MRNLKVCSVFVEINDYDQNIHMKNENEVQYALR